MGDHWEDRKRLSSPVMSDPRQDPQENTDRGCMIPQRPAHGLPPPVHPPRGTRKPTASLGIYVKHSSGGRKLRKSILLGGGWIKRNPRGRTCGDDKRGNISPLEEGHSPGQEGSRGGR